MKVLVTGATGFIGKAVTEKLLERGDDVRVLARTPGKLAEVGLKIDDVVEGDITDPAAVDKACEGIDVVYAIAGTFREPNLSDQRYREVNVDAVRIMLDAARKHGVKRVVHCSTCGIHGSIVGDPADENYPLHPVGIYEETKAAGEQFAFELGREYGVEVSAIRPTPVYGPGDTRLLKLFKLVNKKRTVLLGNGKAGYHLVYIDDLADAFVLAGTVPEAAGEAFLIGGGERPSLNEMIAALAKVLGKQSQQVIRLPAQPIRAAGFVCEVVCRPLGINPPIYRRRVDFFINNRSYNIEKARRLLGYDPKVTMTDGLQRTADWYRGEGLL